jgi:hypothetical protein
MIIEAVALYLHCQQTVPRYGNLQRCASIANLRRSNERIAFLICLQGPNTV